MASQRLRKVDTPPARVPSVLRKVASRRACSRRWRPLHAGRAFVGASRRAAGQFHGRLGTGTVSCQSAAWFLCRLPVVIQFDARVAC